MSKKNIESPLYHLLRRFKLQVRQDWRFNASTALAIGQDGGIENPNIQEMLEKNDKSRR